MVCGGYHVRNVSYKSVQLLSNLCRLCGYPPFYSDNPMQTCHQIVRYKEFLEFPDDIPLSESAMDLISRFLCDQHERIGVNEIDEIKNHAFFNGINWDTIRSQPAPFIPELSSNFDTRYFEDFKSNDMYKTIRENKKFGNMKSVENHLFYGYSYVSKKAKEKRKTILDGTAVFQESSNEPLEYEPHEYISRE